MKTSIKTVPLFSSVMIHPDVKAAVYPTKIEGFPKTDVFEVIDYGENSNTKTLPKAPGTLIINAAFSDQRAMYSPFGENEKVMCDPDINYDFDLDKMNVLKTGFQLKMSK